MGKDTKQLKDLGYQIVCVPTTRTDGLMENSVDWKVTLIHENRTMTFDYSMGVGHIVDHNGKRVNSMGLEVDPKTRMVWATNKKLRKYDNWKGWTGTKENPFPNQKGLGYSGTPIYRPAEPELAQVMANLLDEYDLWDNTANFQQFCDELGYDSDSMKAHKIYTLMGEQAKTFKHFVHDLDAVRKILQDC